MNIELNNVSKNFKNQTVLENVNLKLESGKIYGLVGRNGSGKSVLLKIMTGLMEPSDGIIKYGGIPLKKGQLQGSPSGGRWRNRVSGWSGLRLGL